MKTAARYPSLVTRHPSRFFTINGHVDGLSPPPEINMPWRYRADAAWLSPPPSHESITASRGSWPVLRNRKRTHVPGLVRLDNGHTRSGEVIGFRHAASPDSCRRNLICPAQRGLGHIQTGVSGCAKQAKTPSRRTEGGSSGVAGAKARRARSANEGPHAGAAAFSR